MRAGLAADRAVHRLGRGDDDRRPARDGGLPGARAVSTPGPAADLAVELVSTPSVSGEEETVARRLETWARKSGVHATRDETGVRLEVAGGLPGPTLLLASHLDTVPAGEGWTIDPFAGLVEGGVLRGRGAVDAKASVAAMAAAAAEWTRRGGPARGRLVVLATFG
ncbi:MAG: M20/M25/M40 family metallo-hydrolase, partial [Acidobacteria bacterium]